MADEQIIISVNYDTAEAVKSVDSLTDEIIGLENAQKAMKKRFKDGEISAEKYSVAIEQNRMALSKAKAERKDNIKILKLEVGTRARAKAQLAKYTKELDKTNASTKEGAKRIIELTEKTKKLRAEISKSEQATGDFRRQVGKYPKAMGALKASFGSMLNPIGLVTAAVGGIVAGFKLLIDRNKELNNAQGKTNAFFKATDSDLISLNTNIYTLAKVWDKDFNEVLTATNALAKKFGITGKAAFELVEEGLKKGADINGDFLNQVKEYPTFFKEAGVSASGFVSIIAQTEKAGVFSDKGVDTIKEATLSLREMTPAAQKALEGIGISSKELEKALKSGSMTYFEAIQKVSNKLGSIEANSPAVGAALADIFKGAGEDAGIDYIKMLGTMDLSLDNITTSLTESEQASIKLSEAWNNSVNSMAESGGVLDTVWTGLKNSLADWMDLSSKTSEALNNLFKGEAEAALKNYTEIMHGELIPVFDKVNKKILESGKSAEQQAAMFSAAATTIEKEYGAEAKFLFEQLYNEKKILHEKEVEDNKKAQAQKIIDDKKAATKRKELLKIEAKNKAVIDQKKLDKVKSNTKSVEEIERESLNAREWMRKNASEITKQTSAETTQAVIDNIQKEKDAYLLKVEAEKQAEADFNEWKKQSDAENLENKRANAQMGLDIASQLSAAAFNLYNADLDMKERTELDKQETRTKNLLANTNLTEEQRTDIEEKAATEREKIEKAFAKKRRKAAIAEAIVSGSLAVLKALASVAPPASYVLAATTAVLTGLQIATIKRQQFAEGGEVTGFQVSGPSHAAGGVPIYVGNQYAGEMQGGENIYITKKEASAEINALSEINQKHGGVAFGGGGSTKKHFAEGGEVETETDINSQINEAIERAHVVVRVEDISTGMNERDDVLNVGVIS